MIRCKKPAAERRACTSGPADAKLQPSARGRLRAAGRSATELAGKLFHKNRRLRLAGPNGARQLGRPTYAKSIDASDARTDTLGLQPAKDA